jgi:hypothetical protein
MPKNQKKKEISKSAIYKGRIRPINLALALTLAATSLPGFFPQAHAETAFERLSSLLRATPEGGWVKASTNIYSDAWAKGADAVNYSSYQSPASIVIAWSSFAWDSAGGNLMLWGGGHANYAGNEMYVWDGATGNWGRGSLPSRLDSKQFVIGGGAPQSAHTYDNNVYLPVNDMFLTFGGAAFQSGGNFQTTNGTSVSRAGPYLWDPAKADPNKVGGVTGSGYNTTNVAEGGHMWIDRHGQWTGSEPPNYVNGTTAYRTENGKDVVYVTSDSHSTGFPSLYRYTLGDVRNGEQDTWEKIGASSNAIGFKGAATIDPAHNLYIRTGTVAGRYTSDLMIWDLDKADPKSDIGINLVNSDGTDFKITGNYGLDYDTANNTIVLWDGSEGGGTVWSVDVMTDAAGNIGSNTTWTVTEIPSSTLDHPHGSFATGVLGKWHYDDALGAFIALDEISAAGNGRWDAGVWLYKPMVASIPEPETYALFIAGLGLIGWVARRRRA